MVQSLRAKRIVSRDNDMDEMLLTMTSGFRERGYPHHLVDSHKQKVLGLDRQLLLKQKKKLQNHLLVCLLYPNITSWAQKFPTSLGNIGPLSAIVSPRLRIVGYPPPPLMCYRRSEHLRDLLVKTEVRSGQGIKQTFICPQKKGLFLCLGCTNCKLMLKGSSFQHPTTIKVYHLKHYLTCNSEWVVYLLMYPCSFLYVGETTCTLKTRLNGHRYSIRKKRMDLPVAKHVVEAGHNEWDIPAIAMDFVPQPLRGGDSLTNLKKMWIEMDLHVKHSKTVWS